jgi:hypothetical protein
VFHGEHIAHHLFVIHDGLLIQQHSIAVFHDSQETRRPAQDDRALADSAEVH